MYGLLFLFLALLWVVIAIGLSKLVTMKLPKKWWRILVQIAIVILLLPLPLIDEIIAKPKFEKLCKENSTIHIAPNAAGKTVYLDINKSGDQRIEIGVPVFLKVWQFIDVTTREVVVSYNTLQASGGWFMRAFTEGGVPMIFKGYCSPENRPASIETFKSFGINYIEKPLTKNGE